MSRVSFNLHFWAQIEDKDKEVKGVRIVVVQHLKEIQAIDFSRLDFSEYVGDIQRNLRQNVES